MPTMMAHFSAEPDLLEGVMPGGRSLRHDQQVIIRSWRMIDQENEDVAHQGPVVAGNI